MSMTYTDEELDKLYPIIQTFRDEKSNRLFNWVGNLEWVTHEENIHHSISVGHQVVGIDHKNAKCSEEQIKEVCRLLEDPTVVFRDVSIKTGVPIKTINNIRSGNGWRHISRNYSICMDKRHSGPSYSAVSRYIMNMVNDGKTNKEIRIALKESGLSEGLSCKSISDRIYHIRRELSGNSSTISQL